MIAADTSTWIAFFDGASGEDVVLLDNALADRHLVMLPAVLTELLSEPKLSPAVTELLLDLPLLDVTAGYWERAGRLRARVLGRRRKARLGDALIAQSCVDHGVALLTRDKDFSAFAEVAKLQVLGAAGHRVKRL